MSAAVDTSELITSFRGTGTYWKEKAEGTEKAELEDERPSPARNIEQLEKGVEENSRMMVEVKREVSLFRVKSRGGESAKRESESAEYG